METIRLPAASLALFILLFLFTNSASGSYPRAQNVTWKSTNFKTILTWGPEPSADYSYTVQFSAVGQNKKNDPNCFRRSATVCDLSSSLKDPKACYTADVQSQPPRGETSDVIEPPYTSSPRFCPYKDTDIGRLDFKLEVSANKKTTLYVTDPLTAVFKDGRQLNIRDIFADDLAYKVTYRRNKSTGKKEYVSKTNVIELPDLDRGESYCFNVQAFISSRSPDKQLGELSQTKCSEDKDLSIFEEYSVGVIAGAILVILLLIAIIITVTVICCNRRKNAEGRRSGKEGVPLQNV